MARVLLSSKHLLYLNLLLDSVCWSVLIPTLPGIQAAIGLSTISVGSISSLVSMVTFLTGTVQGQVADKFGRFKMLRASLISQLVGHLLVLLSIRLGSPVMFVLARCAHASCKCAMVISQAILHDISSPTDHLKDLATLVAFSNIAFIIGPVVGGYLYSANVYLPSRVGALVAACSVMLLYTTEWQLQQEHHYSDPAAGGAQVASDIEHDEEAGAVAVKVPLAAARDSGSGPSLMHCLHLKFAFQIGNSLFEALLPQHSQQQLGLSSKTIGALLSWSGVLSAFTNLVVLKRMAQQGDDLQAWLAPLSVAMGLGLALWGVSGSLTVLVVAVTIVTFASNTFLGILQGMISAVQRRAQPHSAPVRIHSEGDLRALHTASTSARDLRWSLSEPGDDKAAAKIPASTSASIYGLSSTADRAARIVSPLLGSVLMDRYGNWGLVLLSLSVLLYCLAIMWAALPAALALTAKMIATWRWTLFRRGHLRKTE